MRSWPVWIDFSSTLPHPPPLSSLPDGRHEECLLITSHVYCIDPKALVRVPDGSAKEEGLGQCQTLAKPTNKHTSALPSAKGYYIIPSAPLLPSLRVSSDPAYYSLFRVCEKIRCHFDYADPKFF